MDIYVRKSCGRLDYMISHEQRKDRSNHNNKEYNSEIDDIN